MPRSVPTMAKRPASKAMSATAASSASDAACLPPAKRPRGSPKREEDQLALQGRGPGLLALQSFCRQPGRFGVGRRTHTRARQREHGLTSGRRRNPKSHLPVL